MASRKSTEIVPRKPKTEVLIDGYLYDITGFRHPGGSIIHFFSSGGDATDAYNQFHMRSTKAKKMLESMPKRLAPPEEVKSADEAYKIRKHEEMTKDLTKWTRQLQAEGWFDWSPLHTLYRIAELIALFAAGVYLIMSGYAKTGLVVLGIFQGRCGWQMHEAGHFSCTSYIPLDILLQEIMFGLGPGMSGGWWRVQHNKHHATPQKLAHDADLDTLPLVAFNEKIATRLRNSALGRAWIKAQAFIFAPVICLLVALSWQFILHPRYMFRVRKYREAIIIAFRYYAIYWFATNVMHASLTNTLLAYLFSTMAGSVYIFVNFALSHTHLTVTDSDEYVHWLDYASVHTINISPNFLTNWWMGYLNFQIEHHIFPSMPQYRFIQLAPQTRAFFEKHGLKYDVRGYWSAMWTTFQNLHTVGNAV